MGLSTTPSITVPTLLFPTPCRGIPLRATNLLMVPPGGVVGWDGGDSDVQEREDGGRGPHGQGEDV